MIACSRMYNLLPEIRAGWDAVFAWVAAASGVPVEVIAHAAPAPLEALWSRPDMACVFMCGWPFTLTDPLPVVIAAPVPSPPRYGGEPVYFTDLVVRRDAPFESLEDTFGGRVAWTVETSHSGFNALRHHLLRFRTPERPHLYRESVGPVITPMAALASVIDGEADVAPLDSFAWDLLARHAPDRVAALRIIDTTIATPIPPLVAGPQIDPETARRLSGAFERIADDPAIRPVLDGLLVDRFALVSADIYAVAEARAAEAVAAGYPAPG